MSRSICSLSRRSGSNDAQIGPRFPSGGSSCRAPERLAAVHASEVALDPDMTAGAALRRVVRSCAEQIVGNEAAVLAGMPEGVHQMRVGVRRLRAILSAFAPLLEEERAGKLSDELRWLGDALGHARNSTPSPRVLSRRPAKRSGTTRARGAECRPRRNARRRLSRCGRGDRLAALYRPRVAPDALVGGKRRRGSAVARARAPLAKVAPKILQRRFKQARRRGARFAKQSPQERHRLRIAMKKLRYATEMLGQLYEGGKPRRLLRVVKRLQEELGKANDLHVSQRSGRRTGARRARCGGDRSRRRRGARLACAAAGAARGQSQETGNEDSGLFLVLVEPAMVRPVDLREYRGSYETARHGALFFLIRL